IIMCTDWGVISRVGPLREDLAQLDLKGRYLLALEAGVDMFGGESDPTPVIELVKEGKVSEERINQSVRKLLKLKFQLGLFENPYVDPYKAQEIVGCAGFKTLGYQAQLESVVLLKNDGTLPLPEAVVDIKPNQISARRPNVYVVGLDANVVKNYANPVTDLAKADFAIVKVDAGGIELSQEKLDLIAGVTRSGVPTILVINFDRAPTVLTPELVGSVNGLLATFDILDSAVLDVIFGRFNPVGKLPFQIPSSMESVLAQKEDVPFDLENPMFDYGFGLSY
ncbi:MAG: glycoside hydrolase family 3 protein, partial [Candidatus Hadarchaeum sp.]